MRKYIYTSLFMLMFTTSFISAQLDLIGQYKLRPEFSNGYGRPLLKSDEPNFFINQRARLGLQYKHSIFQFNVTLQDVRTWGNTSHVGIDNSGLLSIYEANASIFFNKTWSIKLGRQEISYDNQRIFGGLDWAMQGRRHDAAIVTYKDSTWQVDLGGSYNQQKASNKAILYEINNYKTFQYLWAHKDWKNFNASFLFLNNGVDQIYVEDSIKKSRTNYSQTVGAHLNYNRKKLDLMAFGYYQMGFTKDNRTLTGYDVSFAATYKPIKGLGITLGGEILSGTSQLKDTPDDRSHSFSPLYGTNHGFNGFMDNFYVGGEHENSTGLMNPYLKLNYKFKKFGFEVANHLFYSAADIKTPIYNMPGYDPDKSANYYLGYEIDFTFTYKPVDEVAIQFGYSHLFNSTSMERVKYWMNDMKKHSDYVYVMVTIHPFKNLKF